MTTNSISINNIYQAISSLDPSGAFKLISYNLTFHNTLDQSAPWWVFIPFGQWNDPLATPNPSPFESAILQSIQNGEASECFIDISHLSNASRNTPTSQNFFEDPQATRKIADALVGLINQLPPTVIPTIRYIMGRPGSDKPAEDGLVQALYEGNQVTNKNAWIYVGSFTPGIEISAIDLPKSQGLENTSIGIWNFLKAEIEGYSQELHLRLQLVEPKITSWIKRFLQLVSVGFVGPINLGSGSWNHSKIFAVNGSSLVTGGANYWNEYTTGQSGIFDMAMSITGDAAIDGHKFADYLWQFLGSVSPTDGTSWSQGNKLTNPISAFTTAKAPMSPDFPANTGTIAALSVGKSGIWSGPDIQLPMTLFDAVRDFIINVLAAIVEAHLSEKIDIIAFVTKTMSEDNPEFVKVLNDAGINPSAWASKNARNFAISQAQESLKFSQQKFVLDDLMAGSQASEYQELVAEINSFTGSNWSGFVWPYDTLMALGSALSNMSQNTNSSSGVEIVCSYLDPAQGGYNDAVSAKEFMAKLAEVMEGMQTLGYISPKGDIANIISALLVYKRITVTGDSPGNHSKLVIVDDAVCFIGSDNAYPCYNQEFGIWIDDQPSIQSLISQFWNSLWTFAKQG